MRNVLRYLEQTVDAEPNKIAAIDENGKIDYKTLLSRAKSIGSSLALEVKPRSGVVVFAEKSIDVLCAFMGIVYAGAFYVPVDPNFPNQRISDILGVIDPQIVFTTKENLPKLMESGYAGKVRFLGEDYGDTDESILETIRSQSTDIDPLYGIFTSGSTGVPKCVLVSHRSVIDFISTFVVECGICKEDVLGNQAPFDFDVSVKDIYSTFFLGATIVLIPKAYFMAPMKLIDMLDDNKVTTLVWAVSALCMLVRLHGLKYKVPSAINKVMFSGEMMPIKQLNEWRKNYPNGTFINLYGPTEITCNCTYHILDRDYELDDKLPMGKAFNNEKVFLLDDDDKIIVNANESGELCVSGTTLALGYYRNPEMTQRAFVQNPANADYPETIYRTGDLAYYGEDGLLYFGGRKDNQIKHMGHRIELEEVDAAINSIGGVERTCSFLDSRKNKIVAVYVGAVDKATIVNELGSKVPEYMIPNIWVNIDNIPITKNGKMDRKLIIERYNNGEYTIC